MPIDVETVAIDSKVREVGNSRAGPIHDRRAGRVKGVGSVGACRIRALADGEVETALPQWLTSGLVKLCPCHHEPALRFGIEQAARIADGSIDHASRPIEFLRQSEDFSESERSGKLNNAVHIVDVDGTIDRFHDEVIAYGETLIRRLVGELVPTVGETLVEMRQTRKSAEAKAGPRRAPRQAEWWFAFAPGPHRCASSGAEEPGTGGHQPLSSDCPRA